MEELLEELNWTTFMRIGDSVKSVTYIALNVEHWTVILLLHSGASKMLSFFKEALAYLDFLKETFQESYFASLKWADSEAASKNFCFFQKTLSLQINVSASSEKLCF